MTALDVITIVHTIDNPLGGIVPDFSIFGVEFTQLWQKLIAGAWALAIILGVIFLLMAVTQMAAASSGGNPAAYKDARSSALMAAIALGVLAALAVIVGAILAFFG